MGLQMKKFDKYLNEDDDSDGPPCEEDEEEMEIATLPVQEQMFHYVSNGNITKLTYLLDQKDETGLDIDLQNTDGLTPLGIAIREGFLIVVYRLIDHGARIGDSLLRAVDGDFQQAVTVLLEHAVEQVPEIRDQILKCHCETNDMHPDVTPMVRSAQKNNFTLVKILYDIGLRIPDIKMSNFEYSAKDSLQRSVGTLEIYRGLASPAYVCFSTSDPIGRAFKLCATLHKVGLMEVEFNHSYVQLADCMEQFAADLVSYARNTEEIMTILSYSGKTKNKNGDNGRSLGLLPTIDRAITCEQKKFVAQPNCQQAVRAAFYQRLLWLNDKPSPVRLLIQFLIIFLYPVLSVTYKLGLSLWCDNFVKIPAVQYLMQLGSDVTLLTLVLGEVLGGFGQDETSYTDYVPAIYFFAFIYAVGLLWREILHGVYKGAQSLKSFSHVTSILIALLLVTVFMIHVITFLVYHDNPPETSPAIATTAPVIAPSDPAIIQVPPIDYSTLDPSLNTTAMQNIIEDLYEDVYRELEQQEVELDEWTKGVVDHIIEGMLKPRIEPHLILDLPRNDSDPTVLTRAEILQFDWHSSMLVCRALMALAAVISFTRIQPYLITHDEVGPLQISLKSMLLTTSRFGFVVITSLIAFACGLTYIYSETYAMEDDAGKRECVNAQGLKRGGSCSDENYFESIVQSMFSLYWSLFGLMPREAVQSAFIASLLESAGTLLYASFYVFTVVVLLNALIAVMSNVYNHVEENADSEWKFNRTALWMTFLDESFHVPPPFNLLPRMQRIGVYLRAKGRSACGDISLPIKSCRCCCRKTKKKAIRVPLADEVELDGIITPAEVIQTTRDHYKRVMNKIVDRYIADRTSHERNLEGDISIADLRNLKNDVVGLRYELFKKLWNVNEKLEHHSSESGEIRREMVHVNHVFETLAQNKDEMENYREESDRMQDFLKTNMEKLPDIPELPPERKLPEPVREKPPKTVTNIVDFFETLDGDTLGNSLPTVLKVPPKGKSRLPRMVRHAESLNLQPSFTMTSRDSLDSEGSLESSKSERIRPTRTRPVQKKPRRRTALKPPETTGDGTDLSSSHSDDAKEGFRPKLTRKPSVVPKSRSPGRPRGPKLAEMTKGGQPKTAPKTRSKIPSRDHGSTDDTIDSNETARSSELDRAVEGENASTGTEPAESTAAATPATAAGSTAPVTKQPASRSTSPAARQMSPTGQPGPRRQKTKNGAPSDDLSSAPTTEGTAGAARRNSSPAARPMSPTGQTGQRKQKSKDGAETTAKKSKLPKTTPKKR